MDMLRVVILTPNKRLIDISNIEEIYFPTVEGFVGILPGHAPMIVGVGTGVVLYTYGDISGFLRVTGGVAEVTGSTVTLLVDVGEEAQAGDVDVGQAKQSLALR